MIERRKVVERGQSAGDKPHVNDGVGEARSPVLYSESAIAGAKEQISILVGREAASG